MASSNSVCMAAFMLLLLSSSLISSAAPRSLPSPRLNAHHSSLHTLSSLGEGVVPTQTVPLHSSLKGCERNPKGKNGNSDEDWVNDDDEDIVDDSNDEDDIKNK